MEIKNICDEILDVYETKATESNTRTLCAKLISNLQTEVYKNGLQLDSLNHILNLSIKISTSSQRKLKQILEEKLLTFLAFIPDMLWEEKENYALQEVDYEMALNLVKTAKEIFEIQIPRDAFSSKRRGLSIQILEMLSLYIEVPDLMALCKKMLQSKSKNDFLDCIESLKGYYLQKDDTPNEEIIHELNNRISKTKHKVEVVSALTLQVDTGLITELDALMILENWKDKKSSR